MGVWLESVCNIASHTSCVLGVKFGAQTSERFSCGFQKLPCMFPTLERVFKHGNVTTQVPRLGFTGPAQVTTHSPRCTAKSPVGALGLRPRPMLRSRVCVSCGVRLRETSNVPLSPSSTSNLSKRGTNTPFPNSQVLVQGGYISTLLPTACNAGREGALERGLANLLKGSRCSGYAWHSARHRGPDAVWGHKPNLTFFK